MNTNQDQLLDDHTANPVGQLTRHQLIGFLLDKEKFPKEIITNVEFELQRRKLSNADIKALESELRTADNIPLASFNEVYNKFLIAWLIVIICTISFHLLFWQVLLITVSIRGIKNRFTKGISYQQSTWRKFSFFMLLITITTYIFIFFYF